MPDLPTGTITFLFTDIEGSTTRWERHPETMRDAVARHDALLQAIMDTQHGIVFKTVGDAFYVAFASASEAVLAAVTAQHALATESWSDEISPLRVRMALHTGEAELRGNDYFGQALNRVARILSTGHGGQILLSQTTLNMVSGKVPVGITFQDMGRHRLKDIQYPVQIFQLAVIGLPMRFPPLKSLDLRLHNLPLQVMACVGRETEFAAVRVPLLSQQVRLVTLTGPGGIGKTRLVLHVATSVIEAFSDGIWFVELAAIRAVSAIVPAIFQAMAIYETSQQCSFEQLKDRLAGKTLLILDSVEQVHHADAFVADLLIACPQLTILVTSRNTLQLRQEYVCQVNPLALPDAQQLLAPEALMTYGAVAFFVQQAQLAKPDFALNHSNASSIVKICKRLDGLPLAIELVAARMSILSLQAMLIRLDHQLQLFAGSKKPHTEQQQTIRETIDWSYALLSTEEKAVLQQLAIFHSGYTFEAIETICTVVAEVDTDLLDILKSLIDKSLLRQHEGENGEPRFQMMYIIRAYAVEKLRQHEDEEALKQRHAQYYLELAQRIAPKLTGIEQKSALAMLEEERENMEAALTWFIAEGKITAGFHMAEALWRFWWMHGHVNEGQQWLNILLNSEQITTIPCPLRSNALIIASRLAFSQGKYDLAVILAEQVLTLSQTMDDKRTIAAAYTTQAEVAFHKGEYEQATRFLENSLTIQRELDDHRAMASLLNNLGNVIRESGDLTRAASLQEESLLLFRRVEDQWGIATALNSLGEVERRRGNYKRATIFYNEGLKLYRSLSYDEGIAAALVSLGDIERYQGDYTHASTLYKESLTLFRKMKHCIGITVCLQGMAEIAYIQEQLELATRLFAQAEVTAYTIETSLLQYEQNTHRETVKQLRILLDCDSFEGFWTTGQTMTLEQVTKEVFGEDQGLVDIL